MGGVYVKTRKGIHGIKPSTTTTFSGFFKKYFQDFSRRLKKLIAFPGLFKKTEYITRIFQKNKKTKEISRTSAIKKIT